MFDALRRAATAAPGARGVGVRQCDGCGRANESDADFCANPECRTFLGWSSRPAPEPPPPVVPVTTGAGARPAPPQQQRAGVRVTLDPPEVAVEPGGAGTVRVTVKNTGTRVDELRLAVRGPAATVGTIEPAGLRLYPDTTGTATVRLAPQRRPEHTAGRVPFTVAVTSSVDPAVTVAAPGVLVVAPYHGLAAELRPPASRGRRAGPHDLVVRNHGNTPAEVEVRFQGETHAVSFRPGEAFATVPPGGTATVRTFVRARGRFLGRAREHRFAAYVVPRDGHAPLTLAGARQQKARLSWWVVLLLLLLVLVLPTFADAANL